MQLIMTSIKDNIHFIETVHYFIVFIGVVIACIQLNRNTRAHQDEHSPILVVYCPKDKDPIYEPRVENVGNLLACKIKIVVYRINKWLCFSYRKEIDSTEICELRTNKEEEIYSKNFNKEELDNVDRIKVKIKYYSPLRNRKLLINHSAKR